MFDRLDDMLRHYEELMLELNNLKDLHPERVGRGKRNNTGRI